MNRKIYFDHGCGGCEGGCDSCNGLNNSYEKGLKGQPGKQGPPGPRGPSGKNNVLAGSVIAGGSDIEGTDTPLDPQTVISANQLGFDLASNPTFKPTVDTSDTNNTKYFGRLSNGFLNFIFGTFKIGKTLTPPPGDAGNILQSNGSSWGSVTPTYERYNCETTTSLAFNETNISLINSAVTFIVPVGMSYKFKHLVAIVDKNNPLTNYIEGVVESYVGVNLTLRIKNIVGFGNTSGCSVMLTAPDYLPFPKDPNNYGKYLYNDKGIWVTRLTSESVGYCMPWHNPTIPNGWLSCDGNSFAKNEYPALFEHLRPGGSSTKYSFQVDGTTPLGVNNARTPAYNSPSLTGGAFPYGVDGTTVKPGTRFGKNILTGGVPAKNLPVNSPWTLNDPGHTHNFNDGGNSFNNSGFIVTTDSNVGPVTSVPPGGILSSTTGITLKTNDIAGGQTDNGAQDLDIRQLSEGAIWIIKAL